MNKEINQSEDNKDCVILALEPFFPKLLLTIAFLGIIGVIFGIFSK